MITQSPYYHIADFIAALNPKKVFEVSPSEEMQYRFEVLIEREREAELDPVEKDELDHYIVLERLMSLSKAFALSRLSQ